MTTIIEDKLLACCPFCSKEIETDSDQVKSYIESYGCDDCRLGHNEIKGDELLTPEEVMKLYKVGKRWLYDQVARRRIPFRKVGRFLRFSKKELGEWSRKNAEAEH